MKAYKCAPFDDTLFAADSTWPGIGTEPRIMYLLWDSGNWSGNISKWENDNGLAFKKRKKSSTHFGLNKVFAKYAFVC